MSQIALIIKTKSQPGKRDEIRRLWDEHLKPRALDNPDQQVVVYSYDAQDENTFYLFEIYASLKAFEASSKAPWFWEYINLAGPLLDGQPEMVMMNPVFTKGIA